MALKMLGMGFKRYIADKFNILDSIIVLISSIDVAIYYYHHFYAVTNSSAQSSGAISALRAFRLLRVFKLA
jgi:hypothetical protein